MVNTVCILVRRRVDLCAACSRYSRSKSIIGLALACGIKTAERQDSQKELVSMEYDTRKRRDV